MTSDPSPSHSEPVADAADACRRVVWIVSPYHTGSHQAWAEGFARHSRHIVRLLTLDGRFWKWRMQGGATTLERRAEAEAAMGPLPDVVLATDMLNLPVWLTALRRRISASTPVLLFMHENQLTYPLGKGERRDLTYAMINWQSQLAADHIVFNSRSHFDAWFEELPRLLKRFPDYSHLPMVAEVQARSSVLPVGIEVGWQTAPSTHKDGPPLILWNQRWEYDKRPDHFFALLYRLLAAGVPFRLAVAGEDFRNVPEEFEEARQRLADTIVQWGYLPDLSSYHALLQQADLVVSTADHEFFGISVLEAVAAGAFPLLPARLSYPELIPAALHESVLYANREELFQKARAFLTSPQAYADRQSQLRAHVVRSFGWPTVAAQLDDLLEKIAGSVGG